MDWVGLGRVFFYFWLVGLSCWSEVAEIENKFNIHWVNWSHECSGHDGQGVDPWVGKSHNCLHKVVCFVNLQFSKSLNLFSATVFRLGCGSSWVGSKKLDPWTSLDFDPTVPLGHLGDELSHRARSLAMLVATSWVPLTPITCLSSINVSCRVCSNTQN